MERFSRRLGTSGSCYYQRNLMKKDTVPNFIQRFSQRILNQTERYATKEMVNASYTLRCRLRDLTQSDRTSFFNPNTGNWIDVSMPNLYTWNIVKPTIRGNKSSMVTANVKVQIEPRFLKDMESEMAANVAQSIVEQQERTQWTTALEERIADEQQLGAGVFVQTRWNPNIKTQNKVEKWEARPQVIPGGAVCGSCGAEQEVEDAVPDDMGYATVACEQCGAEAQVTAFPQMQEIDVMTGYEEHSFGAPETIAHQFWNFRVDTMGTEGGDLEKARWFEHHYAAALDELQLEYPESAEVLEGSTNIDWSYAVKWQIALETGTSQPTDFTNNLVDEYREVRDIYLTPAKYDIFEATEDFSLKNGEGKSRFSLKKGQGFRQATFEGEPFKEPPVLCFRLVGDNLIDIYPCDFRKDFVYMTFLANPSAFWGLFYTELLSLQDSVNYLYTLLMYHIRRNAITSIVYNTQAFDPDDFEEDLIPTKDDVPFDVPINSTYGIIPALSLSAEPMNMINMILSGQSSVTQVQPAMLGEKQPNETYSAQLLQKQQSLGLLAPAELSKATGKVKWAKRQLELKREHWTDEDTQTLLRLNTDWNEDTINAFLKCDLDHDLIIDFQQGSEVPRSLLEREASLRQFLTDVLALAQINPMLLSQDNWSELLLRLSEATGVEIDIQNTEATLRLAETRYDKLKAIVGEKEQESEYPPDAAPQIAQQIMNHPAVKLQLQPQIRESHAPQIEYISDKINAESAKDEPNYLLVACLNIQIDWHDKAEVMWQQRQAMMAMAAQAPMMEQQQQMQAQAQEANAQAEEKKRLMDEETAQKQRAVQAMESEAQREADMEKHQMTLEAQANKQTEQQYAE